MLLWILIEIILGKNNVQQSDLLHLWIVCLLDGHLCHTLTHITYCSHPTQRLLHLSPAMFIVFPKRWGSSAATMLLLVLLNLSPRGQGEKVGGYFGMPLSFAQWCSKNFCNLRLFAVIGGELMMVDSVRIEEEYCAMLCCCMLWYLFDYV